jgi:hypothetical protein
MTIRGWVMARLAEEKIAEARDWELRPVEANGIRIDESGRTTVWCYCVQPSESESFSVDHFKSALSEMPTTQFIVVTRRQVEHDVYTVADLTPVGIDGVRLLMNTLLERGDPRLALSSARAYVARRLETSRAVKTWKRIGQDAYEVVCANSGRVVRFAAVRTYEATADEVYNTLYYYRELDVSEIVSTNPAAQDFAGSAREAAESAGSSLVSMKDFLMSLYAR